MSGVAASAGQVPVMMGRRRSQETVRGGDRVSGSELAKLLLMGEFLGFFGFQKLLMLERDLSILRLEELLLLQLNHMIGFFHLLLSTQFCSGNPLLLLLQGCRSDRGSTGHAGGRESRRGRRTNCRRDGGTRGHASCSSGGVSGCAANDKLGWVTRLGRRLVHTGEVG